MASRTVPIDFVRTTVAFALTQGWDVNDMLRAAGVSPMLLAEGRSRVTEEQITRFTQELWRRTDDELFGLGEQPLPRGSFRLLCYGMLGSADLGVMLDRFQGFTRVMPALPPIDVVTEGDRVRVTVGLDPRMTMGPDADDTLLGPLAVVTALAVVHRLSAWAIGRDVPLLAVELPYPPSHEESHQLVFAAPLVFGARLPALVLDRGILGSPVMRDAAELDEFIARSPAGLLSRPSYGASVAGQVRRMVEQAIRTAAGTVPGGDDVAGRLAMSPQTLRRRLAAEDTSLREIRDEVLRDAAVTALVQGDETLSQLAERLGFSEPSAFTRAFRRWTGSPPTAYR